MARLETKNGKFGKHNCNAIGYAGDVPYLYYKGHSYTDGIGRGHLQLYFKCDICGKEVMVARIHTDGKDKLYSKEQLK